MDNQQVSPINGYNQDNNFETINNQPINPVNINNSSVNSKNKKNIKNIIIIILIIVISFVSGILCGKKFNNSCSNENNTNNTQNTSNSSTNDTQKETYTFNKIKIEASDVKAAENNELSNKIEINNVFFNPNYTDSGKTRPMYLYGKNNNSIPVQVEIIIEYYDKDNVRIDKNTEGTHVYANSEFTAALNYIKDDSQYEKVKLSYTVKKLKSYETIIPVEKLEITHNKTTDNNIKGFIKNNSGMSGYFEVACIYYKDGKVVFANNQTYISLEHDETKDFSFYSYFLKKNPAYNTTEKIDFDDYKVFIQSGYNVNTDNY